MARKTKPTGTCEFSGCNSPAAWRAHKLWGKGGSICVCDGHKPDASKRPESLRHLPFFYRVEPIGDDD